MKIRSQIALYLTPFILVVTVAIFLLNFVLIRHTLKEKALADLYGIAQNTQQAAQTLLSTSIRNYLRAITEKNIEYLNAVYADTQKGLLSEQQAKEMVRNHFQQQSVGKTGYLLALEVKDDKLFLAQHPYISGQECTTIEGCQAWAEAKNGYIEYTWQNPKESGFRRKAAYIQEFTPWNWIVGASSYRDDFVNLVKVADLAELIAPIRINQTGYFCLFDQDWKMLIHPDLSTLGKTALINSAGEDIIELLRTSPDRYVTYSWRNQNEHTERKKYAIRTRLDKYNWYLVGTGYVSEIYQPIAFLNHFTLLMILISGIALILIILRLGKRIGSPLLALEQQVVQFNQNRSPMQWQHHPIEEIDVLGDTFASMSTELNRSLLDLYAKNMELAASKQENEASRDMLDAIVNSMPSVIIGVDPNLAITTWNHRAEQFTGQSLDKVLGCSLFAILPDIEPHHALLQESITGRKTRTFSHSRQDGEDRLRYFEITIYPLLTSVQAGAVIRIDEVTTRVAMEQRLRQTQKMDAVGQLAGGIAHDFNNLLTGIVGAAELLKLKVRPEEQGLVKIVRNSSSRASELIKKLLAFSRKEPLAFTPIDMHRIIEDSVDILRRSLDKRITIDVALNAQTNLILGDWSQIQNCLLNIGINAGHAMPRGGSLTFSTNTTYLDDMYCSHCQFDIAPGHYLMIDISDSGTGINKDNLRHIFEPFFTTKEQNEGTGLGLAAVYAAMQQHHGAIAVDSEVGAGTTFTLILPLTQAQEQEQTPPPDDQVVPGEGCILVIDDESVVRTTACMMLEKLGYSTMEAVNGKEGVDLYLKHQYQIDLVVLDMLMPVMDGTECFHQLKRINPKVRIIISSGFTRDADLGDLRNQGLCSFIRKPYNMTDLSRAIAEALATCPT